MWENTCLPKDFEVAGTINTRVLNEALLSKWVYRIYDHEGGRHLLSIAGETILISQDIPYLQPQRRVSLLDRDWRD
jgi:hypothetical protein